jgi:hypothetical protein
LDFYLVLLTRDIGILSLVEEREGVLGDFVNIEAGDGERIVISVQQ